ncbi:Co2+/Mg2+ efflux protein ApaG [Yunchengibacter salinarum]|uniref:Co2+/Mg2+ efflux protein ApaG n=1 Tax=Yunchengibacter salinarum TaxID=3133399 RepID=UPI0035B6436B
MSEDLINGVMTFEEETDGVRVAVQSYFLEDQSEPDTGQYVWAYRIRLHNERPTPVQLLTRHWIITNGLGEEHEVKGEGVIGEQPVIDPGEAFVYTSGTPLDTPTGFMRGSYGMRAEDGSRFTVTVPTFSLDSPFQTTRIN